MPSTIIRTRWRFGSKRRLVATIEWERLCPKPGFFPQTEQTLDTAAQGSRLRALCPRAGAQLREHVGHLERRPDGVGGAVDPRLGLLDGVGREHAERDG